jgi:hypothetical protein
MGFSGGLVFSTRRGVVEKDKIMAGEIPANPATLVMIRTD